MLHPHRRTQIIVPSMVKEHLILYQEILTRMRQTVELSSPGSFAPIDQRIITIRRVHSEPQKSGPRSSFGRHLEHKGHNP